MNKLIPSLAALITAAAVCAPSANAGVSFAFNVGPFTIASAPNCEPPLSMVVAPPPACVRTVPVYAYPTAVLIRPTPVFVAAPAFPAPGYGYGPGRYHHRPHGRICW